jgi:putative membrane protein
MTVVLYTALLLLGVTLLALTVVRVLVGGLADASRRTPSSRPSPGESARRTLDVRYAAGELSTEEYQQRLRVLEGRDR